MKYILLALLALFLPDYQPAPVLCDGGNEGGDAWIDEWEARLVAR